MQILAREGLDFALGMMCGSINVNIRISKSRDRIDTSDDMPPSPSGCPSKIEKRVS